jgi:esterase/lipase
MARKVVRWALLALAIAAAGPALAEDKLGVILMHGKQGQPGKQIIGLASSMSSAGFLVETPEMCWSKSRIYDRTYEDCLAELDRAAATLTERGATAIVVAGHSLGGNGALYYAAHHPVKGVISIAGAHNPKFALRKPEIAESLAKAKAMVADGKGDQTANFNEINAGWTFTVSTTARIYESFFDPQGPTVMPDSVSHLKAPLLWVAGDRDQTQQAAQALFALAPADPLNRYVTVAADHMQTPDAGKDAVISWLKELAAR